jgi:hypothetical protein
VNKNIFAYTEFEYKTYPAYVSLNERDGKFFLTVRSREGMNSSEIEIPREELHKLEYSIFEKVA